MWRVGAFARNRDDRRRWWNDHLWLQMLTIAIICVAAGLGEGLNVVGVVVGTVAVVAAVYATARFMLRAERRE